MFDIGDMIIYRSTGVCQVTNVVKRTAPGSKIEREFYVLKPVYADYTISAPAFNDKIFMRPVISKEAANELIDMIPSMNAKAFHTRVLRQLSEHYEELMKSHDCADLIELTMSIYEKKRVLEKQKRKFGAVDEKFMRRAEELLFGELAVSLGMPKEKVPEYIEARIAGKEGMENTNDC